MSGFKSVAVIAALAICVFGCTASTEEVPEENPPAKDDTPQVTTVQGVHPTHGFGLKSGAVCPYGKVFLCFNAACGCY